MGIALLVEGDSATARTTFAVGVIVAATSGASVICQVDRWTLSLQSAIHFTIMLATALPALFLGDWLTLDRPVDYLAVLGNFQVTDLAILAGDVPRVRSGPAETTDKPRTVHREQHLMHPRPSRVRRTTA